jgi:hypothetical protein
MNMPQMLAIALAVVAAAGFGQAGRLLGGEGRGWPDAPIGVFIAIDGAALFWISAAVYAVGHAKIATPMGLLCAGAFAVAGLATMAWVLSRRPRQDHYSPPSTLSLHRRASR